MLARIIIALFSGLAEARPLPKINDHKQ